MRKLSYIALLLSILTILPACGGDESEQGLTPIARVHDNKLYLEDILSEIPLDLSEKDSIEYTNTLINEWIRRQILVDEAEKKVSDVEHIEDKVNKFREDLLIHALEVMIISSQMDTTVSESEIKDYYRNNVEEFTLKDYLVKVLYIQVPSNAPNINEIEKRYALRSPSDIEFIKNYAKQYALNFYYDTESWIYFEELTKEIPLRTYNKESFILRKSHTRVDDNEIIHFLNIIDYRLKDALSPLEFERENIKNRIINKRILRYRKDYENKLIEDAYNKNDIEKY